MLKSSSVTTQHAQTAGQASAYCDLKSLMALRWTAKTMALPKAKKASRPQSGVHHSRFRGRGMEFSEVRAYQAGDDVRSIDWRVTARRQTPHTKLFNEERERPIVIICDQSQTQFFGSQVTFKSVRAAQTAALFAWTALNHNDRVGGIVFSEKGHEEFRPARSRKNILRFMSCLCEFNQALSLQKENVDKPFNLNSALAESLRILKPGSLVIVISDFLHSDAETAKQLRLTAQHNELILARTFDPLEEHLPPPGLYPVSDGDDIIVFNSSTSTTQNQYQSWVMSKNQELEQLANLCRAPLLRVSTQQDPAMTLQGILASISN